VERRRSGKKEVGMLTAIRLNEAELLQVYDALLQVVESSRVEQPLATSGRSREYLGQRLALCNAVLQKLRQAEPALAKRHATFAASRPAAREALKATT
jgi:hypothetical protein